MRALALLLLLPLAACGSDFWDQPAYPAPTGISSSHNGLDPTGAGAEPLFSAKGSRATYGFGVQR